jgi:hypothetical protein
MNAMEQYIVEEVRLSLAGAYRGHCLTCDVVPTLEANVIVIGACQRRHHRLVHPAAHEMDDKAMVYEEQVVKSHHR